MMDNITMAIPTIEKLNRLVGFIIEENTQVPNGINSIATENIIPKTLSKYMSSTFLWVYEKICMLNIVKNKLKINGMSRITK